MSSIAKQLNKVAEITLLFWLMKIVATTLGETLGDFLSMTLDLGYLTALGITLGLFVVCVLLQISTRKYVPVLYWMVIIATTTLGTEISDFIDRSLHLGYSLGSLLLVTLLVLTLFLWFKKYRNLEVYPINQRTREVYYWSAILFSNSLGTAFGDFLGEYFGLSYLEGATITGAIIVVVVMLHYFTRINHIVLFWIAFIFTRPFGATFGDFLTKPVKSGGLDLGTLNASLVSMVIMCLFMYLSHRQYHKINLNRSIE